MKKTVVFAAVIFLLSCNSKAKKEADEKENYKKATEMLLEKEKKNPAAFITVNSHDKHNLLGQTVIKAMINNTAKVCMYKDVQLELSFYSKTGTLLEKDNQVVYENIAPGKSVDFKTKYFAPKASDSVVIKVMGAKVKQ